jgi:hypothetical protein
MIAPLPVDVEMMPWLSIMPFLSDGIINITKPILLPLTLIRVILIKSYPAK